jgi:hypothetical protein
MSDSASTNTAGGLVESPPMLAKGEKVKSPDERGEEMEYHTELVVTDTPNK